MAPRPQLMVAVEMSDLAVLSYSYVKLSEGAGGVCAFSGMEGSKELKRCVNYAKIFPLIRIFVPFPLRTFTTIL